MDREQLDKSLNVQLELFKTFIQLFTAVVAGMVALAQVKERPDGFRYYMWAGGIIAAVLLWVTGVALFKVMQLRDQYNQTPKS